MFLDDIAAELVVLGVGAIGSVIFLSSSAVIPTGVGPYMTLKDTGGSGSTRKQNTDGAATRRPTAQILVRAQTYAAARALAWTAYAGLDGRWNVTLSGTVYLSIKARQEPTDLGLDGAGRAMVAFNIDAEKAP